jgi:hypothetical protein
MYVCVFACKAYIAMRERGCEGKVHDADGTPVVCLVAFISDLTTATCTSHARKTRCGIVQQKRDEWTHGVRPVTEWTVVEIDRDATERSTPACTPPSLAIAFCDCVWVLSKGTVNE